MPPPSGVTTVPVQPHIAEPLLTETRPTEGNFVRFLGDFNDKIKEAHDRTLRLIRESHTAAESAGALEHFLLAADTVVRGMGEVLFMKYPKTAEGKPIVVSGEDPINFKAIDASGIPKTGRYRELLEGLILASEKMAATKESLAKNNPMTPAACEKALEDLYYPAFESLDMTIQMLAKETTQGIAPPAPPQTRPTRPNGELTQEERVKREDSILTFQTFNDAIKRAYDMAFNFIHGSFLARHGDTPETTRIRKEKAAADSAAALMRFLGNVDTGVQNMGWELAGMYQLKTTDGRPIPATPKSDSDRIDFSKVDMRGIPATDQYRRLLYELIKADGKLTLTKGTAERLAADDKMDPDVKRLACERELRDLYAGTFEPIGITVQGLNPNEPLPKVDPPSPAAGRGQAQLKAPPANRNRAAGKVVDHKAMLCAQIYSFSPRPVSYVRRA